MFSVVVPLYNKELSIKQTIQSVLEQTFTDFEIIVVNDGSTDNSLRVIQKIDDPRIRIIDKPNGGVSSARNRGIKEAKFEWIAFLDGDDLWMLNHLEVICKMLSKYPNDKVFCTSFVKSDQEHPQKENNLIIVIEDYFTEAIKRHFFWTSIAVVHKSVFDQVGVFKEHLSRGEDLDLWARIGLHYRFIKSNEITAIYVQESENKLSHQKTSIDKSIVSDINFNNLTVNQKRYFKKLVVNKIKSCILILDIATVSKLIFKYRTNLL